MLREVGLGEGKQHMVAYATGVSWLEAQEGTAEDLRWRGASAVMQATASMGTGAVRAEHACSGTSCGSLTLKVGKSPTATRWRAELPVV